MMKSSVCLAVVLLTAFTPLPLAGQPEAYPWSNISGIRVDGQRFDINSALCLAGPDWSHFRKSEKEQASYHFERRGTVQHVRLEMEPVTFYQSVEPLGLGGARVRLETVSSRDTALTGAFFLLSLSAERYDPDKVQLLGSAGSGQNGEGVAIPDLMTRGQATGVRLAGTDRMLEVQSPESTEVIIRRVDHGGSDVLEIYFTLMAGFLKAGASESQIFDIRVEGITDRAPVTVTLDTERTGRPFTGFGGNFRLQNPGVDEKVIDYCLDHLQVRYGRVEMPWMFWQPEAGNNPLENARNGQLHPRVRAAMEMAARLNRLGMPVILSDWSAPDWAITGSRRFGENPEGLRGNPLDPEKMEEIYRSIGDYLQYVKETYGFEFALFSFNESDLGINVRQTPEEHAALIRGLGAYLKSRGLITKLLLGDTADATGWPFIRPAMEDPETHPFIGAISFHSWRGYSVENLEAWARAADRMQLPLLVGEGSMDAGAWRYPDVFSESTYAMEEANLYVRILKICQPLSILQWQLTADYSPMTGGGVFGNINEPLTPTQRFWNFKQIADMPEGLYAIPAEADRPGIICAALGDPGRDVYVIHLVNNGASRRVTLNGLPPEVRTATIYTTNEERNMWRDVTFRRRSGSIAFDAGANSFITLIADTTSPF